MMFAKPQNLLLHDIVLILKGLYVPYGKDLGLRFKLVMFTVLYQATKPRMAWLLGSFPDAVSSIQELKLVLQELQWEVKREEETTLTYEYGVYLGERLAREEGSREIRRTLRAAIEFYIDYIENLEGLKRSYSDDNRIDPQLAELLGKMMSRDISGVNIHQENRELRELLAYQIAGAGLYGDDGELSDSTQHPGIDFRRDTPGQIKRTIIRRNEIKREKEKQT